MSYINKVLVANRGEIACRVIKTAKKMGIKTVAVYSDIDKDSKFVQMSDEAYNVGPAPALQSYLRADKIIDIALHTKSQAIHPGFGFLSENASFADNCETNNLIFVGPPAEAIRKMGSKSESKLIMTNAQVPVVPGYHGDTQSYDFLLNEAKKIGFPVLIKAVMGGGGKGMRTVFSESQFQEALEGAKRESLKSFKDDRVLIEKYIERPRHIEVQVFGDKHGNYVHFFERDCSIQRRHQKVLEEAPSSLDELLRKEIGGHAIAAAKAVNYTNAGTVEFIFDLNSQRYFFMEMNTRLQVEHPVSEMITGVDLVEWQFRVANGEKLPLKQEDIKKNGHAIEVRIYSESPRNDFLPGNGKLDIYKEPQEQENVVRIDTGVREKDQISIFYDPMIAKLIVWGKNRDLAISQMKYALTDYKIIGLPNNINFLKNVLKHQEYIQQNYDTGFIAKNKDVLLQQKENFELVDIAAAIAGRNFIESLKFPPNLRNFRNNYLLTREYDVKVSSEHYKNTLGCEVELVVSSSGKSRVVFKDKEINFEKISFKDQNVLLFETCSGVIQRTLFEKDNAVYLFDQEGDPILIVQKNLLLQFQKEFTSEQIEEQKEQEIQGTNIIKAPMPCTITKISVTVGQKVTKGTVLVIMEAMKMEHTIKASLDGVVKKIDCKEGSFADPGKVLITLE